MGASPRLASTQLASLEATGSDRNRMSPGAGCGQAFGLTSFFRLGRVPTVHRFPNPEGPVLGAGRLLGVEFVLADRCGAAPAFHRVSS
jgi:hypothetical protein